MKQIYEKIWDLALPRQDNKGDIGHAKVTREYAYKLLETEKGNPDVVIPAIILHDIGWSKLTEDEGMSVFDPHKTREQKLEMRYKHQEEGVKLAGTLLGQLNYPPNLTEEILEIISEHDTRVGFISLNEGLVRDADKLWRFSKTGFSADMKRRTFSFQQEYDLLVSELDIPNYFYSQKASQIAINELSMTGIKNPKIEQSSPTKFSPYLIIQR